MMKDVWNGPPGFRPTKSAPSSPAKPLGLSRTRSDSFHALHKVPVGDTPYVRAKNVQLVEKDPERAIPLFWAAINAGDRVDSALKDMAIVMKQQNRAEEAIEAIKSLRVRCSDQAQESLDNILLDLYKRCGRLDDQIGLLKHKLFLIQQGMAFNGKRTKTARSQGKKFQVSVEQEGTRLLGNLGWALMQKENYKEAEDAYRRALCIAPDNNKMCNLGICLMKQGRIREAKETLRRVKPAVVDGPRGVDSHLKAYERSQQMLKDLESDMMSRGGDDTVEQRRLFDAIFGSSSIWQPQPCRESSSSSSSSTTTANAAVVEENNNAKPKVVSPPPKPVRDDDDDSYADENVNVNVNVIGNSNRAQFPPLHNSQRSVKQSFEPFPRSSSSMWKQAQSNNVLINSLNVDAKPFVCSKLVSNEKLKRTRSLLVGTKNEEEEEEALLSSSPVGRRRLSMEKNCGLPDNNDFQEAILAAVLGTDTTTTTNKKVSSHRLKVFQDITLSLSPRA